MQGGKLAAQYDKESKGERNMAFKQVSCICLLLLILTYCVSHDARTIICLFESPTRRLLAGRGSIMGMRPVAYTGGLLDMALCLSQHLLDCWRMTAVEAVARASRPQWRPLLYLGPTYRV